jgi:hypothetical protein
MSIKATLGCKQPTVGSGANQVKTIIKRKNAMALTCPSGVEGLEAAAEGLGVAAEGSSFFFFSVSSAVVE